MWDSAANVATRVAEIKAAEAAASGAIGTTSPIGQNGFLKSFDIVKRKVNAMDFVDPVTSRFRQRAGSSYTPLRHSEPHGMASCTRRICRRSLSLK